MFNPQFRDNSKLSWSRMVYLSPPYSTVVQFSNLCRIRFLETCKISICVIEEGAKFTQGDSIPAPGPFPPLCPPQVLAGVTFLTKAAPPFSMEKLKIQAWKITRFQILSPANSFLLLGYSNLTKVTVERKGMNRKLLSLYICFGFL